MLPDPLTPPYDESSEPTIQTEILNGPMSSLAQGQLLQDEFATPISHANADFDIQDHRFEDGDRSQISDISDEDHDMDDQGGVPLTTDIFAAQSLNVEMDAIDAEIMGAGNMAELWAQAYTSQDDEVMYLPYFGYPIDDFDSPTFPDSDQIDVPGHFSGLVVEDAPMPGSNSLSDLPATMSEVSLQLQQLHDGQEHAGAVEGADEPHGDFLDNNSISSLLLPSYSSLLVGHSVHTSVDPQLDSLSLFQVFHTPPAVSADNAPIAPQSWQSEDLSSSTAVAIGTAAQSEWSLLNVSDHAAFANDASSEADEVEVEDQYNFSFSRFLQRWGQMSSAHPKQHEISPSLVSLERQTHAKLHPMPAEDLRGDACDIQRINWEELGVTRSQAKQMRRRTYRNYTNLRYHQARWHPRREASRLIDNEDFFRFRRMNFSHSVHLSHFQLRNLIACPTQDHIFYAGKSRVLHWDPTPGLRRSWPTTTMNLTDPVVQPFNGFQGGIQISTLSVAHDILVAGGFCGEYGLMNLRGQKEDVHTEGLIIDHNNSITNHVQVQLSRHSSLPQAVFASNDTGVRILDISTNKFVAEHMYDHAMNCSAISPDQRLRVLVGDTREVMICNAETGQILQRLHGHRDFGFACDWADDGWTVATGNQDMQIMIWDARKWTTSDGRSNPVKAIAAEMAGVRKLKFSPLGSGKRVLLAAEPADLISVIDASTYDSKQTLSFFGEIGGVDFTNDGQNIWVANCDDMRGGLMEFERCGFAKYGAQDLERETHTHRRCTSTHNAPRLNAGSYDWVSDDEEMDRHPRILGGRETRDRRGASLATSMGYF